MRKLYKLTNYIFIESSKKWFCIYAAMMLIESIALFFTVSLKDNVFLPYEVLVQKSGIPIMFGMAFVAVYCVGGIAAENCYKKSKSIYTLMTLPIPRWNIYFAYVTSGIISFIILLAVQYLIILITYCPIMIFSDIISKQIPVLLENGNAIMVEGSKMENGLFLAFTRSGFIRNIIPLDFIRWLVQVILCICIVISMHYSVLATHVKRRFSMGGSVIYLYTLVQFNLLDQKPLGDYYICLIVLVIIISIWSAYKSIDILNESENI